MPKLTHLRVLITCLTRGHAPRKSIISCHRNFPSMACLFFGLLPTDLQIDILYVWLNTADCGCSLLKVLSALDVACGKSQRSPFRLLMGQLPPFGEGAGHCGNIRATRYIARCLQWLASRHVPVTALLAGNRGHQLEAVGSNLILPLVETLHWRVFESSTENLTAVLQCLPNLTVIHQAEYSRATVNASLVPKLKVLANAARPGNSWSPFIGSCLQLQELRMKHFPLTVELSEQLKECCPNLQLLGVSMRDMAFNNLVKLLGSCASLQDLVLYKLKGVKITEFAAFPNIKRLTFKRSSHNCYDILEVCNGFKDQFADLQYLQADSFVFAPNEGRLRLPSYFGGLSTEQLSRILSSFSLLEVIVVNAKINSDMASLLVQQFGKTLKSLTVLVVGPELEILLHGCGVCLRNLALATCPLALIAATCPNLVTLSVVGCASDFSDNDGFYALSAACVNLKELTLTIHAPNHCLNALQKETLLSTIAQKLRLRLLHLMGTLDAADAAWFRQRVKELQLLPAPTIVIEK